LLLLGLAWLAGCPGDSSGTNDGGSGDMPKTDGGPAKVQQPGCSTDDWCWQFPQPQGNTLRAVWGSSDNDVWAVGDSGALVHFVGGQYKPVVSPTANPLHGLWGSGPNDIYAVGDRATVLHYDGQTWSRLPIAGGETGIGALNSVWGAGPDSVWIVGADGVVLHRSGGTLTRVNHGATTSLLLSVWGTGNSVYAVGGGGTLLTYDGTTWSASVISGGTALEYLTAITGTDADNIFVASLNGQSSIIRRFHGGSWGSVSTCTDVPPPDPPVLCGPASPAGIYTLWAKGSDVFAAGDVLYTDTMNRDLTHRHGTVKRWDGSKFIDMPQPGAPAVGYYGVWGSSATNLFLVGLSGTIVRFDGTNFTSTSPVDNLTGVAAPMVGIAGSSSNSLTAVGDWGTTLRWNGTQWSSIPSNVHIHFRGISGTSENLWSVAQDPTAVGNREFIYQFQGNGWTSIIPPTNDELLNIWVSGNSGFVVGANDTLLRRSGNSWSTIVGVTPFVGTALRGAWGVDDTHAWIVGGGDSQNQNQTKYPGKILFFNGISASEVPNVPKNCPPDPRTNMTRERCTLFATWAADVQHVWAVGDEGVILATSDGTSWAHQQSGTRFSLRGVWGTSATDVYAVGTGGILLHFDGQTWHKQDSGTSIDLVNIWGVGKDLYITGFSGTVLHRKLP